VQQDHRTEIEFLQETEAKAAKLTKIVIIYDHMSCDLASVTEFQMCQDKKYRKGIFSFGKNKMMGANDDKFSGTNKV